MTACTFTQIIAKLATPNMAVQSSPVVFHNELQHFINFRYRNDSLTIICHIDTKVWMWKYCFQNYFGIVLTNSRVGSCKEKKKQNKFINKFTFFRCWKLCVTMEMSSAAECYCIPIFVVAGNDACKSNRKTRFMREQFNPRKCANAWRTFAMAAPSEMGTCVQLWMFFFFATAGGKNRVLYIDCSFPCVVRIIGKWSNDTSFVAYRLLRRMEIICWAWIQRNSSVPNLEL